MPCIVGLAKCGCVVAAAWITSEKDKARFEREFEADGLAVEYRDEAIISSELHEYGYCAKTERRVKELESALSQLESENAAPIEETARDILEGAKQKFIAKRDFAMATTLRDLQTTGAVEPAAPISFEEFSDACYNLGGGTDHMRALYKRMRSAGKVELRPMDEAPRDGNEILAYWRGSIGKLVKALILYIDRITAECDTNEPNYDSDSEGRRYLLEGWYSIEKAEDGSCIGFHRIDVDFIGWLPLPEVEVKT